MGQNSADNPALQAKRLLSILKTSDEEQALKCADDLLLFCYRLLDEYIIVQSTSPRFTGRTFNPLRDIIYQLESQPAETLRSEEWRRFLESLLEHIQTGSIVLKKK